MLRKQHIFQFIFCVICLCTMILQTEYIATARADGNIYYVDFNYSGVENGSSKQPYNTMNEAVSIAACGDKIYMKEGTYNIPYSRIEDIEVKKFKPDCTCKSHTPSEMLTITVDPAANGKVILNAIGNFGSNSFFRIRNSKCIHLEGDNRLIIDGSAATFDANYSLVSIYSYIDIIEDIVFENVEARNSTGRGISFRQEIGTSPGNIIIRNNKIHGIAYRAVGGFGNTIYIEGNEIWNAAKSNENQSYGSGGWPGVIQTARRYDQSSDTYHYCKNIFVKNNIIRDCWGEGIIINSTLGGEISKNKIYNVFSVSIYVVTSKDITINRNHLYRTTDTYDRNDKSVPAANGISFASESHIWGAGQTPIIIENLCISNNLIDNVGKGVSHWHDPGNKYATNSYKDVFIFHNILRKLNGTPIQIDDVPTGFNAPLNGQIKNNIIENSGIKKPETYDIGDENVWAFSNNNWTGGLPSTGMHIGSHNNEPGFVGPDLSTGSDPANYRLAKGSNNIAAGTGTRITDDYWGTSRNRTNPSIGIHEFTTEINSPTGLEVTVQP